MPHAPRPDAFKFKRAEVRPGVDIAYRGFGDSRLAPDGFYDLAGRVARSA
jgi:hypothetical protein